MQRLPFYCMPNDLRQEFVDTLLSVIGPQTVLLLGYTPRRPDEVDLLQALERQGCLDVTEIPNELLDFKDLQKSVEDVGMFEAMFNIVPKVKLFRVVRKL